MKYPNNPKFKGFACDYVGRIFTGAEIELKPYRGSCGYWCVWMNGHNVYVQVFVADCFLGLKPDGKEVNHKDGDKAHNHPNNLEYLTHSENISHAYAIGLLKNTDHDGEGNGNNVYPDILIEYARHLHESVKLSGAAICRLTGIKQGSIWDVLKYRTRVRKTSKREATNV